MPQLERSTFSAESADLELIQALWMLLDEAEYGGFYSCQPSDRPCDVRTGTALANISAVCPPLPAQQA
jgi:hypothetical protein